MYRWSSLVAIVGLAVCNTGGRIGTASGAEASISAAEEVARIATKRFSLTISTDCTAQLTTTDGVAGTRGTRLPLLRLYNDITAAMPENLSPCVSAAALPSDPHNTASATTVVVTAPNESGTITLAFEVGKVGLVVKVIDVLKW